MDIGRILRIGIIRDYADRSNQCYVDASPCTRSSDYMDEPREEKMIVTEKQILIMLRVMEGSLSIADRTDRNMFGYDREERIRIYNEIVNQQSDKKIDVKET